MKNLKTGMLVSCPGNTNDFKAEKRRPESTSNVGQAIEIEQPQLNYNFEIIKSCIIALITFLVHIFLGAGTAILTLLALYFITQRFAGDLNNKLYNRKIGRPWDEPPVPEEDGIPESLNRIDWVKISKLPGVDAERLKDTFEYLYKRVHEGSLEIESSGEWKEISKEESKLRERNKKVN